MSGQADVLRVGQLAPSMLREALLDGPAGIDPVGLALVNLLDAGGLLACPGFAAQCVDLALDEDDGTLLYADLDLDRMLAAALGEDSPLRLDPTAHLLLSTAVGLVDLASGLRLLGPSVQLAVLTALTGFVQAVGPQVGLTLTVSTAADASVPGPDGHAPVPGLLPVAGTFHDVLTHDGAQGDVLPFRGAL